MKQKLQVISAPVLALIMVIVLFGSALAIQEFSDVTNFDGIHLQGTFATATPQLMVDQQGAGVIFEARDNATPVVQIPDGGGLTVNSGGLTVTSGGQTVSAGLAVFAGGINCTPQAETVAAGFVLTPTSCILNLTSSGEVTSSTTTGIITTTATSGDIIFLANNNASDVINVDGTGGTIECKANVALGASDVLGLWYNGTDSVWNCLFNYDNS